MSKILHLQVFRYALVGFANTVLTASVILVLTFFQVGLYTANLTGYIAGIILSYFLNSLFTFSSNISVSKSIKFLMTCGICYLINLVVMNIVIYINPNLYLIQVFGMIAYTISGFFINKYWVMK